MKLLKTEMTPKERLLSYSKGEEVDRIPIALIAGETIPLLYGISISDYYFSADLMVRVESKIAEDFQADNMGMGLGLRTLVEALGTKLKYSDNNVSYILEPAVRDYSELEGRRFIDIEKDGRIPIMIEAFKRLLDLFGEKRTIGTGSAGPFTIAAGLIGTEKFLKDMRKNPDGIHQAMKYSTENYIQFATDIYNKLKIKSMISEPMICRNILSPSNFKNFAAPYLRRAIEHMTKVYGGPPGIHACGVTHDRWEEIINLGIGSFSVDNCESLLELKKQHGEDIAIVGNVAPVDVLKNGTVADVEEDVIRCISQAGDNPCGYTLCPGCTIPIGTSKENIIAFMNAGAVYGKEARKGKMPKGIEAYIDRESDKP